MPKHGFYEGIWTFKHFNKNGKLLYEQTQRNAFADEGEYMLLNSFFRGLSSPSGFYLRLAYDVLKVTDTLVDVYAEPGVGYGYSAKTIERSAVGFPTIAMDSGHYMATTKHVTWVASGGVIGPLNVMYLATTSDNTGKLVCYVPLLVEQTVEDGDSAEAWVTIKFI